MAQTFPERPVKWLWLDLGIFDVTEYHVPCRSCTGGKTEDFMAAAQLMHKAKQQVKVPTFLVPATQKVPPPLQIARPPPWCLSCRGRFVYHAHCRERETLHHLVGFRTPRHLPVL